MSLKLKKLIYSCSFLAVLIIGIILTIFKAPYLEYGIILIFFSCFSFLYLICKKYFKDYELLENNKNKWTIKFRNFFRVKENQISFLKKTIYIILIGIFIARYMADHDYLETVIALKSDLMGPFFVVISVLFNSYWIGAIILIGLGLFLNSTLLSKINKYISLPIIGIVFIFFPFIMQGIVGAELTSFRCILMAIEVGLGGFLLFTNIYEDYDFKLNKPEVYGLLVGIFIVIVCGINDYMPQVVIGLQMGLLPLPLDFNISHRLFVMLAFILPIIYFFLLYKFDIPHRRAFLTLIATLTFFSYIAIRRYEIWVSIPSWPLHLCNTAMYIIPLTLIFKTHKVFYFTMFINVIGAFLALLMPNYSETTMPLYPYIIEFYINHMYAFFMPVLIVVLGIYDRPKIRYFLYSMAGFLVYFVFVLVINTYYTGIGESVDFFFINSNFVGDKLGQWADDLFDIIWQFKIGENTFVLHPLYQLCFYLTYVGFALGMWYVYELLFKVVDGTTLLIEKNKVYKESNYAFLKMQKERGIDMKKKQTVDYNNLEATLIINHLCKQYGTSKAPTVKDFSCKLEGGKIYGFLGKNGAGKSTIIKSIVGMHTFNSGEISVCGFDCKHEMVEAKSCIGFVPDHYALYENLTGRQYINYIADLYNVSKEDRENRLVDLLDKLEMKDKFDKQMKTYSHGMKQKITIIGALIHNPKVWILDEPMTGVDPNSIFQIKECMREHARKGNIVFFSSHLIDVVVNLCDEVVIIKHGDFVYRNSIEDIKKNKIDLEQLFLLKTSDNSEETNKIILEEEEIKNGNKQ